MSLEASFLLVVIILGSTGIGWFLHVLIDPWMRRNRKNTHRLPSCPNPSTQPKVVSVTTSEAITSVTLELVIADIAYTYTHETFCTEGNLEALVNLSNEDVNWRSIKPLYIHIPLKQLNLVNVLPGSSILEHGLRVKLAYQENGKAPNATASCMEVMEIMLTYYPQTGFSYVRDLTLNPESIKVNVIGVTIGKHVKTEKPFQGFLNNGG